MVEAVNDELQPVALLELQRRDVGDVALQRPDPALLRDDDGDRFLLDHRLLDRFQIGFRCVREQRAAAADLGRLGEFLLHLADFPGDGLPLLVVGGEQRLDLRLLLRQGIELGADLEFLELAQGAQPHVEDRFGLQVGEREALDQGGLRLVLLADDADDFVEIEIGDEIAAQDFETAVDGGQPEARTAQQDLAAMVQPFEQHLVQRHHLGHAAHRQHVHVERNAVFEFRQLEQQFHQDRRIDRTALRHQHQPHILGQFVAHVFEQRQLAGEQQLGDLLDQPRLLHLEGNFGDDDLITAAAGILDFPFGTHAETAAAGLVGLDDAFAAVDDDAAGRKVGTFDAAPLGIVRIEHQVFDGRARVLDQVQRRVAEFMGVVRRDGGRHADGDAGGAVRQKVREGAGHDDRFLIFLVIGRAKIHRVLVDAFEQKARDIGHARFGVPVWPQHCRRRYCRSCPGRRRSGNAARNPAPGAPARHRPTGRHAGGTYR